MRVVKEFIGYFLRKKIELNWNLYMYFWIWLVLKKKNVIIDIIYFFKYKSFVFFFEINVEFYLIKNIFCLFILYIIL